MKERAMKKFLYMLSFSLLWSFLEAGHSHEYTHLKRRYPRNCAKKSDLPAIDDDFGYAPHYSKRKKTCKV